jgi:outer membrane protein assembly factor BamB
MTPWSCHLAALSALLALALPPDWPAFRGPQGDNSYDGPPLGTSWDESGPPVAWRVDIGPGFAGVAVRDEVVYLLDRYTGEADMLRTFALEGGTEGWEFGYPAPGRLSFAGSRNVPSVTDEHVYTVGGFGQVHCVLRASGEPVWSLEQEDRFGAERPFFGWCQAPLLFEDLLILAPLGREVGVAAVNRFTGETVWTADDVGESHSTPTLFELNGRPQILMVGAKVPASERGSDMTPAESEVAARDGHGGYLASLDPRTGALLWSSFAPACTSPVAPATRVDDHRVFITGGYRAGSVLLEIDEVDGEFTVAEVFRHPLGSSVQPAVLWDEHLFLTTTENFNEARPFWPQAGLMCLDLTGAERWRTGAEPNFGRGALLIADGLLIVLDGHDGTLRLIEASGEAYRTVAEANLFPEERRREGRMWAPMALADGRLLVRSQEELVCVDLRRPE